MDVHPNPRLTLQHETDIGLITFMGCAEFDESHARLALEELYRRHGSLLLAIANEGPWNDHGIDTSLILLQTFEKAYRAAATFDPQARYPNLPESKAVKLWLISILKNALRDALRSVKRRLQFVPTDPEEISRFCEEQPIQIDFGEADEHIDEPSEARRRRERTEEWLAALPPQDRDLLLLSASYINVRTNRCEIPPDELQGLATLLGVIPATIKVKRQRLLKKLEAFLLQNP